MKFGEVMCNGDYDNGKAEPSVSATSMLIS
jgi:hypothetical protein